MADPAPRDGPASETAPAALVQVLITGGAGFIGAHLAGALLAHGHAVRVLDDLSSGSVDRLARGPRPGAQLVVGDIRDAARVRQAMAGCGAVFHLAAQVSVPASVADPKATWDVNVAGTRCLLESATEAGVETFVFASSCAVYGPWRGAPQSEADPPAPASPYAESKLAGERLVSDWAEAGGRRGVNLRFFNVHGPGQLATRAGAAAAPPAVVPALLASLRAGTAPVLHGDGRQERDFCHVSDVVHACQLALAATAAGPFNVGTGVATSIATLLDLLQGLLGTRLQPRREPARAGDVDRSQADLTRARAGLGYEPRVSLLAGLRTVVEEPAD